MRPLPLRLVLDRRRETEARNNLAHIVASTERMAGLTADVLAQVAARDWPGNVCELRNAPDRYVLALGLSRKTLYEKMHKHGLRREDFTAI